MNEWNYLSDAELHQLMEDVEKNTICKAPDYLKNQILKEAARQTRTNQKTSFLFFCAKIVTAAAASIALLFAMPKMTQSEEFLQKASTIQEDSFLNRINQKTNRFCSFLSDTTNSIFVKETIQ